jgi:hypothetical protein
LKKKKLFLHKNKIQLFYWEKNYFYTKIGTFVSLMECHLSEYYVFTQK